MVLAGGRRIVGVAVCGDHPQPVTPCGGCRQKLREFATDSLKIHLCGPKGVERTVTLGELFPMSFGPSHIGKP